MAVCSKMNKYVEETKLHYENTDYKEAIRTGLFELQTARDEYRELSQSGMHRDLVLRYIEIQAVVLCPICPHITEYIWGLLKKVSND